MHASTFSIVATSEGVEEDVGSRRGDRELEKVMFSFLNWVAKVGSLIDSYFEVIHFFIFNI